MATNERKVFSR